MALYVILDKSIVSVFLYVLSVFYVVPKLVFLCWFCYVLFFQELSCFVVSMCYRCCSRMQPRCKLIWEIEFWLHLSLLCICFLPCTKLCCFPLIWSGWALFSIGKKMYLHILETVQYYCKVRNQDILEIGTWNNWF